MLLWSTQSIGESVAQIILVIGSFMGAGWPKSCTLPLHHRFPRINVYFLQHYSFDCPIVRQSRGNGCMLMFAERVV
jgi:hypothetical protein